MQWGHILNFRGREQRIRLYKSDNFLLGQLTKLINKEEENI